MRFPLRLIALAIAAALSSGAARGQEADAPRPAPTDAGPAWFEWASFDETCGGECSASLFAGQWINSAMSEIFLWGDDPKSPFEWRWREDYIVGAALNRRVARVFDLIDLEAEVGAAIRFGEATVGEGWIAAYARWTEFPWNGVVRTSFAINTGLSWATAVSEQELQRSRTARGSRLLHYLAPEITLAPAAWARTDLFVRFHHRSGGNDIWGDTALFKGVSGGAQYWVAGIRHDF